MKAKLLCLMRRFYDNSYVICMSLAAIIFLGILLFGCAGQVVKDTPAESPHAKIEIVNLTDYLYDVMVYRIIDGEDVLIHGPLTVSKDLNETILLNRNTIYHVCIEKTFGGERFCTFKKIDKDETWRIRKK